MQTQFKLMQYFWISMIALIILLGLASLGSAQTMMVSFDTLTTMERYHLHFEVCSSTPPSQVILPQVNISNARFLKMFYSWSQTDHPSVDIMVLPDTSGELLYIDRNYNQDLSDDGPPDLFRFDQPAFIYDIVSRTDSLQRTRMLLARTLKYLNLPDSLLNYVVDPEGNMRASFVNSWRMMSGIESFNGIFGTFYWDNRLCVRAGILPSDNQVTRLGVYDWSNNGIFNDSVDQILVATGPNEEMSDADPSRVYQISDVIPLLGSNWKVLTLDRYGRSLTLGKTDLPLQGIRRTAHDTTTTNYHIDEAVWTLALNDINGQRISLDQLRGYTILMNFWGEWCRPCLAEIPELVQTASLQGTNPEFKVVSILHINNIEKAKSIIHNRGISWPQYLETPEIVKYFRVSGYPTNILLFPDGRTAVLLHSVDSSTIRRLLK